MFLGNKNVLCNTGIEAACLQFIFTKFTCSAKKVLVRVPSQKALDLLNK